MGFGFIGILAVVGGIFAGAVFPSIGAWFRARAALMEAQAELCRTQARDLERRGPG